MTQSPWPAIVASVFCMHPFFISRCLYNWDLVSAAGLQSKLCETCKRHISLALCATHFQLGESFISCQIFFLFIKLPEAVPSFPLFIMFHVQEDLFFQSASSGQTLYCKNPQKIIHHGDLGWKWSRLKAFLGSSDDSAACVSLKAQRAACFEIKGNQSKQEFWNYIPKHLASRNIARSPTSPP